MLQISLFQRSKANHNHPLVVVWWVHVVANIIISKIESKSQRFLTPNPVESCCCKYHYFKDRKQITTARSRPVPRPLLLQISLFQRSKANHNYKGEKITLGEVVANIIISKIESKSQPAYSCIIKE